MRRYAPIAGIAVLAAFLYAIQPAIADGINTGGVASAQLTRACSFASGGWTIVDCSNVAAATSAQLTAGARYVLQCGDDSHLAWGAASVVADTSDGFVPNGAWLEFWTGNKDDARFYSCLNKNSDQDCRHIECR